MITTPITPDLVCGALELERTATGLLPHRLPTWARTQSRDGQLHLAFTAYRRAIQYVRVAPGWIGGTA